MLVSPRLIICKAKCSQQLLKRPLCLRAAHPERHGSRKHSGSKTRAFSITRPISTDLPEMARQKSKSNTEAMTVL